MKKLFDKLFGLLAKAPRKQSFASPRDMPRNADALMPKSPHMTPSNNECWLPGAVILDTYEVRNYSDDKPYAEGGMGRVYRVLHREWQMELAIKVPRRMFCQTPEQITRLVKECDTWVTLGLHPHVACCYYVRIVNELPCLFAEFVNGGNLYEAIRSRKLYIGSQNEICSRLIDISIQLAWGLHYAHEKGVIHQDVKPHNVLLTSDGLVKLTDFGLANALVCGLKISESIAGLTIQAGYGGMTKQYCCAPSKARRFLSDERSDVSKPSQ